MIMRRDFFLLVTLAAAAATPALAQTAVPAGESPRGTPQSAASTPDLTGLWGHPSLPGFEPPASGPGPVRNRSRLPNGVANFNRLVGDYTNPILKPEAAEIVRQHGEISLRGEGYPTPSNQCWPGGVPYLFTSFGIQVIQQADRVTILYGQDHEVRRIWLNQSHPAHLTPSWNGDSVGRYEGDTLVVDTVGIKVEPFNMIDMYGTPHTEALHVAERYRMLEYEDAKEGFERDAKENLIVAANVNPNYKGRTLQLKFTVEDEGVFTMPWSATITFRPAFGTWQENICAENRNEPTPRKESAVPTANKPDF